VDHGTKADKSARMYHSRAIQCLTRKCSVRGYPGGQNLSSSAEIGK
jgi:hypothetical protein